MAQYDGSIRINTAINTRGFDRGMNHLRDGMVSIGKSMGESSRLSASGLGLLGLFLLENRQLKQQVIYRKCKMLLIRLLAACLTRWRNLQKTL